MKKIYYLIIVSLLICSCNNNNPSVDKLKTEGDLISEIKISINSEYDNWKIDNNNIINVVRNVKMNFTDSTIIIYGLDQHNYQIEETVLMTYVTTSKQTRECFEDLKKIHKKASITKIYRKLNK